MRSCWQSKVAIKTAHYAELSRLNLDRNVCESLAWSDVFAGVAQLVERKLPKLEVAGSNPVARSIFSSLKL